MGRRSTQQVARKESFLELVFLEHPSARGRTGRLLVKFLVGLNMSDGGGEESWRGLAMAPGSQASY